ncbi:MAG TPA: hypothetical protein VLA36_15170 [Longimicrobiales bacterium]|nr:hypothetical protein [Longimicrobiales bacterium]
MTVHMAGIQLTTLGRTDLTTGDGGVVLSVLAQPKRFALLVYLAVEGSNGLIRRDTVAALFWPEQDQADARANLRKSLYFLRQSLGQDVVVTRGDEEVGVDPSLLECDVVTLLDGGLTAWNRDAAAAEGPFLEGFHFSGAPVEWEDWLDGVRQRVRVSQADLNEPGGSGRSHGQASVAEVGRPSDLSQLARWRRIALGASVLMVLLVIGVAWAVLRGVEARSPVRYDRIVLGSGLLFPRVVHRRTALPADGSGILFFDTVGGNPGSWWKPLNQPAASRVTGLDRALAPTFSPDGRWIAFVRDGQLLKQSRDGGEPLPLADSVSSDFSPGVAWLGGGDLLFEDERHQLRRVSEHGGTPERVATEEAVGRVFHVSGLPGGGGALVVGCDGTCEIRTPRLSFVDFRRDTVLDVQSGVWKAWPMSDGRVVLADGEGVVSAASFDPTTGTLGPLVPLLTGVRVSPFPEVTLGADGSLLYIPGGIELTVRMPVWVDRGGQEEPVDSAWPPLRDIRSLALSPDGTRLALGMRPFYSDTLGEQLWTKELPGGSLSPLTEGPAQARRPAWAPDGRSLAFITQFQQDDSTWVSFVSSIPADGSSVEADTLLRGDQPILEVDLGNDGRTAVVRTGDAATGEGNLAFASLGAAPALRSLLDSRAGEYEIDLSPDGRWLAYVSDVSGRPEVFVRPFPGPGPRVQVSQNGGVEPRWAHEGGEIFYRSLGSGGTNPPRSAFMMAARLRTGSELQVESTTRLCPDKYFRGNHVRLYDVSADDRRFILVEPANQRSSQGEVVYSKGWYWSEEVQARLGG